MVEMKPFTEQDGIVQLKGGHRIRRYMVQLFTPWCAFCKVYLMTESTETSAYAMLATHIKMYHDD